MIRFGSAVSADLQQRIGGALEVKSGHCLPRPRAIYFDDRSVMARVVVAKAAQEEAGSL